MAFQLAPAPQPIGVWNQFIARQSETLILREKVLSLSGDSFDITLQNGQPILKVQGKVMSISGRKSVYDMAGNHLFDIVKELLHIHATYAAIDPSGRKLLEVKSSFARKSSLPPNRAECSRLLSQFSGQRRLAPSRTPRRANPSRSR